MEESLRYIDAKITNTNNIINRIIVENIDDRDYMSSNILSNLRYLVEYCFFRVYITDKIKDYIEFNHLNNGLSIQYIKSCANMRDLRTLHHFLQISTSHSLPNGDGSSRVMIKYLSYLIELKEFMYEKYHINILDNLYSFPLNVEKNMESYYKQISIHVNEIKIDKKKRVNFNQYYVRKNKPIIIDNSLFYEITLSDATDYINKFNRIVVYSKERIQDNYAIKISTIDRTISLFERNINIKIIDNYKIAVRPCEFNNLSKVFGLNYRISSKYGEYDLFMNFLKSHNCNLLDIVELNEEDYNKIKNEITNGAKTHYIIDLIDLSRSIVINNMPGCNIIKYFLFKLNNLVIKSQLSSTSNTKLSNLYLCNGCIPFDTMPYASSLINHNVDIDDLLQCIDIEERKCELLSRRLNYNSDSLGIIYNKLSDINISDSLLEELITEFNSKLYLPLHDGRKIINDNKYVYIKGYETETISIIKKLTELTINGYDDYSNIFKGWEEITDYIFTDPNKYEICKNIFTNSKTALLYGSAGCGKTETIKIVSEILQHRKIVFLAKTNPAVENLKRRIGTENTNFVFKTIDKYLNNPVNCDLLVIDECSTVDNYDMNKILYLNSKYELLLLVGDIYQIESIKFGNWFKFAKDLLPEHCINELDGTFRTKDPVLLKLWTKVRELDDDIIEYLSDNDMSDILNENIFNKCSEDEIILCLNYDGPYGINSINKYLQTDNPNQLYEWGINSYKVGDPVLFNDLNRFYPVLYNNLKGRIVNIVKTEEKIIFDILVDIIVTDEMAMMVGLDIVEKKDEKTIIRFSVNSNNDDDIEDKKDCVVPFVIAYATSIHKSQGLEYNSVKIVLNDEIGDVITHNIFYTAITRAKVSLKIYWTPECMNKIVGNFAIKKNDDINIIKYKINE